jgi:hypothetical protein
LVSVARAAVKMRMPFASTHLPPAQPARAPIRWIKPSRLL